MKKLFISLLATLVLSSFVMAAENSVYDFSWLDQDKEIYVLQNRKYRKDDSLYLSLVGGKTTSGAFIDAQTYQGRIGYFFTENFGVELLYAKTQSKTNTSFSDINRIANTYYRKVENYMGGMVLWSPFYAKINTFNKVIYFDWIFGLGGAKVETKNNKQKLINPTDDRLTSENHTALMWGTGPRFYLSEHWSIRLDLTAFHYKANKQLDTNLEKSTRFSNYDLTAGVNFSF